MKEQTIKYYDDNALELIDNYNNANMEKVYKVMGKYISHGDKVLDIGFGSGRDIIYFSSKNIDMWGIDGSQVFIETFKGKYPKFSNHIFHSILPKLYLGNKKENFFDVIYSIATWMHLPKSDYTEAILNIKKNLKQDGVFILSYSYNIRQNDPRFFETIIPEEIILLFQTLGFELVESIKSQDGLKRNRIKWITQIFRLIEKGKSNGNRNLTSL